MSLTPSPPLPAKTIGLLRWALVPLLAWWSICFGLYFFGWPITYTQVNLAQVCLITAACAAAMVVGVQYSRHVQLGDGSTLETPPRRWQSLQPVVGLLLLVVLFVPMTRAYSAFGLGSLGEALGSQASVYAQTTQLIEEGGAARRTLVIWQTVAAPLTLMALPYFAFAWFDRRKHVLLFLLSGAIPIVMSILTGRDQQLGMMVLLVAAAWALAAGRRGRRISMKQIALSGALVVAVLLVIAQRKQARLGGRLPCAPGEAVCSSGSSQSTLLETLVRVVSGYASQGFEGLGHAFEGSWVFGGGLSHSPALVSFFGEPAVPTVSSQLDLHGWSSTGYWSTAFTGIANDVPWLVVPLVIFAQALLLGLSWQAAARTGDPVSITVACLTWVSLFYVPQNLQLALSGPTYLGYLVLTALFVIRTIPGKGINRHPASAPDDVPAKTPPLRGPRRPPPPARTRSERSPAPSVRQPGQRWPPPRPASSPR
jgi:hypothetical protein